MKDLRSSSGRTISGETLGVFAFSILLLLGIHVVDLLRPLSPEASGSVYFAVLAFLTFRTWIQTGRGNHPMFLFMLFLILFQFGRMITWILFGNWTMSQFDLSVAVPFQVPDDVLKRSMLLVPLSAAFVYLGFFWTSSRRQLSFRGHPLMRTFFGWLFIVTTPFVLFKDVSYLKYALENGGYVATYLGEGEHLQQVGLVIRAIALLNTMAFLPYIVVEDRTKYLAYAIAAYLLVLILELLVGFRGKFFINLMFLWMILNIKRGSSFKPITAMVGFVVLAGAAVAAGMFRQSLAGPDINLVEYFLMTQGVSFFVTVSSVQFYDTFHPYGWSYLFNQFLLAYVHVSQFGLHDLLTLDLTAFLNPNIVNYALGTGDAYLANLYLIGGLAGVALGSLGLGFFAAWLGTASTIFWRTVSLSVFLWIPYLPRSGLFEPLANATKYLALASVAFFLFAIFCWLRGTTGTRGTK